MVKVCLALHVWRKGFLKYYYDETMAIMVIPCGDQVSMRAVAEYN